MMSLFVPAVVLALLSAILLLVYSIAKRSADKSFYLLFLSIATFLYIFGYLLEIQSLSMEAAYYGLRVQYMGLPLIFPLAYLSIREFYGEKRLRPATTVLLMVVPVLSILFVQHYPTLRIYYSRVDYIANHFIANCRVYPGPFYYVGVGYSYLFSALILLRILSRIKSGGRRQLWQNLAWLFACALPTAANFCYLVFIDIVRFDPTPIITTVTIALILYAVEFNKPFNVLPLARVRVIEDMQDALIICDKNMNFLDANRAAKALFPKLKSLLPGQNMDQVPNFRREGELWMAVEGRVRFFKVTQAQITEGPKHSGVCIVYHDITEKEQLLKKLHIQATFDPLLHVYNRATFFEMANLTLNSNEAKTLAYAALMIDIDHFKPVNDTYGHPCGDIVLETIALLVKGHFRKGDLVGRYGGEEIVVLLENLTADQAFAAADKLRQIIERTPIYCQQETLGVTVSIGVVHSPAGESHSLERMVAQADTALYQAKNSGRNKVCLY